MTKSEQMSRITGNNLKPEMKVKWKLDQLGHSYERNVTRLPGSPDFLLGKIALFVHGCFWHGCPKHCKMPKTNVEFWTKKFKDNMARDKRVTSELEAMGYEVLVIWEHSLKNLG